ncbi:unnamed protein product, partial [Amoebophrya sp. A120]
ETLLIPPQYPTTRCSVVVSVRKGQHEDGHRARRSLSLSPDRIRLANCDPRTLAIHDGEIPRLFDDNGEKFLYQDVMKPSLEKVFR